MAITPRIPENYRYASTLDRLNTVRSMADETNEIAASGRKLRKISDDPVATVQVLRNRARITNLEQFRKTIDFGKGFLSKTEDSLTSIHDSLTRVKELAIQQSNSTYDDPSHKVVANEVRQILEHVVNLGNTTYSDKYVFGGFQTSTPPISPDGHYMGDDGKIFLQVDEDSFQAINTSGREIFDAPINSAHPRPGLITILQNVYTSLADYNKNELHKSMGDIDKVMDTIITVTSSLGGKQKALEDVAERLDKGEVQLYSDNNNLESADMVKSAVDLRRAENALQFTMQASSKMLTPSLLEFLK